MSGRPGSSTAIAWCAGLSVPAPARREGIRYVPIRGLAWRSTGPSRRPRAALPRVGHVCPRRGDGRHHPKREGLYIRPLSSVWRSGYPDACQMQFFASQAPLIGRCSWTIPPPSVPLHGRDAFVSSLARPETADLRQERTAVRSSKRAVVKGEGPKTAALARQEVGVRTSFTLLKVREVTRVSVRFGFKARSARV